MPSLSEVALQVICYGLFVLFVVVDGLRHSLSFKTLVLTVPHIVAALALVRSSLSAFRSQQRWHSGLSVLGLLSFAALA